MTTDDMELDIYCAFCGVCFGIYTGLYHGRVYDDDTLWTRYFLALRKQSVTGGEDQISNSNWYLSGVGYLIDSDGGLVPSPGYDVRDGGDQRFYEQVVAYTDDHVKCVPNLEIIYPIHPACWDLFSQDHALLAGANASTPDLDILGSVLASQPLEEYQRGLRPDWTQNYSGPEQFWEDGWLYPEEPEESELACILECSDEWDFLVYDPTSFPNFDELLQGPPLISNDKTSNTNRLAFGHGDLFSKLPPEIILNILCLLPTPSVQAIRLASKGFGAVHLASIYWRSRFDYPNELSHINLPPNILTLQSENSQIDWQNLCDKLLHLPEPQHKGWKNRKRISLLTTKLVRRILSVNKMELGCSASASSGKVAI